MDAPDPMSRSDRELWRQFAGIRPATGGACPALLELAAFADGSLDETAREAVEEHLAECGDCRSAIGAARAAGLEAGTLPLVPRHVLESARALVDRRRRVSGGRLRNAGWLAAGRWPAAAAASVAICAVAYRLGAGVPGAGEADRLLRDVSFGLLGSADPEAGLDLFVMTSGDGS